MVDLEPVEADGRRADDGTGRPQQRSVSVMTTAWATCCAFDAERLRILLERHLLTPAARARALLDDWDNALGKFVKVMPRDYARALKQIEAERARRRPRRG
jgi:glutamate synthase (NADPH/NADH) large chain